MPENQGQAKQLLPALELIGGAFSPKSQSQAVTFSGVCYDSRKVKPGDAFVCIEGEKFDGNKFIDDAIKAGASCIISQRAEDKPLPVPYVVVKDVRYALARLAAYFYDEPSSKIRLIGITGTNGKTTTTHLIEQILLRDRRKVGLIGTLGARFSEANEPSQYLDTKHTTPQASDLQALLHDMAKKNVSHITMEVSSHALALGRVEACDFAVACLTNVTQDHLDFHKTMEHYWKSKRRLFEMLTKSKQSNKTAVINLDDPLAPKFIKSTISEDELSVVRKSDVISKLTTVENQLDITGEHVIQTLRELGYDLKKHASALDKATVAEVILALNKKNQQASTNLKSIGNVSSKPVDSVRVWTYGWDGPADIFVKSAKFDFRGTSLSLKTPHGELDLRLHLNGRFNVYNVMAAVLICLAEGVDLEVCKDALEDFKGVPGRFETVSTSRDTEEPLCIVDYAHTPDGLENILKAARALVPADGKLIAVFGCGGDRDSSKRPQMGQIAEKLADKVVVTSDNPRSENPEVIIAHILPGITRMQGVTVEPDRARAINLAVTQASPRDIVVVAGKGHETYQILADRTIDFDDRIEVRKALEDRKNGSH